MNWKKIAVFVLLILLSVKVFSQTATLDEAIKTTALELGQRLTARNKIAVLNFSSNWHRLSAYVIDELDNAIVRNGSLTVVDRQQLDLARKELKFQMTEEVSIESSQSAGKFLGAQSVLSGSFTMIGNTYRFRVRVIAVETGVVQYSNSIDIKKDDVLTALTPKRKPSLPTLPLPIIFDDYTIYNRLAIFGYEYSPDLPLGFSLGFFGIYTSMGFALPDWEGIYKSDNTYDSSGSYAAQRYEIIDWVIGYNVTIIPKLLYLPVGVGIEATREWRLQYWPFLGEEWHPASEWENKFLFEVGLLFRPTNDIEFGVDSTFSPYIFGSYRNIGLNKHTFSIGAGISFESQR